MTTTLLQSEQVIGFHMYSFISDARPYVEFVYFLAGIGLAIGIIVGWKQLAEFRNDSTVGNYRLSKEKAIEASDIYMSRYIPLSNEMYDKTKAVHKVAYSGKVGDFSIESLGGSAVDLALAFMKSNLGTAGHLNVLELVASMFVSGVADKRTGYRIIGRSFCETVKNNYDYLVLLRSQSKEQPYWYNIVELHKVWFERLRHGELEYDLGKTQETLRNLSPDRKLAAVATGQ